MTRRLQSFSRLILALAVASFVSSRTALPQDLEIPNFAAGGAKPVLPATLPDPGEPPPQPALPAPPDLPASTQNRPKPADPRPSPPKSTSRPLAAPEPAKAPELDAETLPAAADSDAEKNSLGPLGPAKKRPGEAASGKTDARPAESLVLKTEQIPAGRQTVGLAVEVVAPEVMNVNHSGTIKIVVKNTGAVDAKAVRIRYDLPPELEFVSAQPKQEQLAGEPSFYWGPKTVAAGSDWLILVKAKAIKVNMIDHAAQVTLAVGSRSRTVIQEPMLKVEQNVTPGQLLKGQQASFRIFVTNPGSGPARNVVVRATLSTGLKADGEDIVEQTIPVIQAQERMELEPLVADTIAGGEQTCTVLATSPDVSGGPDAKATCSVIVLRPELDLVMTGPEIGYTDTFATYKVVVSNPGTAAAKDVRVTLAFPPNSGRLPNPLPSGAVWNRTKSTVTWTIPKIEPKVGDTPGREMASFRVRLGSPGLYRVVGDARAGDLHDSDAVSTTVTGLAEIELNVTERRRVVEVGEMPIFDITMRNVGSKTAKNLLVRAELSKNLTAKDIYGFDDNLEAKPDSENGLVFPVIPALAVGRELKIGFRATATQAGSAKCRVFVMHDDLPDKDVPLEDIVQTRITGASDRQLK